MTTGEQIKQRRVELGLSVDKVASVLGRSRATVYKYENNSIKNIPIAILIPLAKLLQSDPTILYVIQRQKETSWSMKMIIRLCHVIKGLLFLLYFYNVFISSHRYNF